MADRKGYRPLRNPAKVCHHLRNVITKSSTKSIRLDEVRNVFESLDEGVWTTEDVTAFFTRSKQQMFTIRDSQLYLYSDDSSSGEDDDERTKCKSSSRRKTQSKTTGAVTEEADSCQGCRDVAATVDETLEDIDELKKSIEQNQHFLKECKEAVQRLKECTAPARTVCEGDLDADREASSASGLQHSSKAGSDPQAQPSSSTSMDVSMRFGAGTPTRPSASPSTSNTNMVVLSGAATQPRQSIPAGSSSTNPKKDDSDSSDELQRKREILNAMNSSRKLYTRSQIEKRVVLAPKPEHRVPPKIKLCSSSDESSDSETDETNSPVNKNSGQTSAKYESYSDDEDIGPCPDAPARPNPEPEVAAIQNMMMRDVLRQARETSIAGLFDLKDELDEERSGRHDPFKINSDLVKYTGGRLSEDEINTYVEYFRKLQGGSITHLSTGSVVAAVLDLYELDFDKQRLAFLMETMQEESANRPNSAEM